MGTGGKMAHVIGMTLVTGPVANEGGPFDFRGNDHGALDARTGAKDDSQPGGRCGKTPPPTQARATNGKHALKVAKPSSPVQADSENFTGNHLACDAAAH